jgi:hypothetical protein
MRGKDCFVPRLLICGLALILGALAGAVLVGVAWQGLNRGVIHPWGVQPRHPHYAVSLVCILSGAMAAFGLALPGGNRGK